MLALDRCSAILLLPAMLVCCFDFVIVESM